MGNKILSAPGLALNAVPGIPFSSLYPLYALPSDLPNCNVYLRADQQVVTTPGAFTWTDTIAISGSAQDATDGGTAARSPTQVSTSQNGRSFKAIRFNGTSNSLTGAGTAFQIGAAPGTRVSVVAQLGYGLPNFIFDGNGIRAGLIQSAAGGVLPTFGPFGTLALFDGADYSCANNSAGYGGGAAFPTNTTPVYHLVIEEFNGVASTISVDGGPPVVGTITTVPNGLTIGAAAPGNIFYCNCDVVEVSQFSRLLSANEKLSLLAHAMHEYGVGRFATCSMIAQGDSIMAGGPAACTGSPLLMAHPEILLRNYLGGTPVPSVNLPGIATGKWLCTNLGQGGYTAQAEAGAGVFAGLDAKYIDPSFDRFLYIVALGVNDISAGRTAAQVQADLTTIATEARAAFTAAGKPFRMMLNTVTGNAAWTAPEQAVWTALNTSIKASFVAMGYDILADHTANPAFSALPPGGGGTYYTNGGLHPNAAGLASYAADEAAALQTAGWQ